MEHFEILDSKHSLIKVTYHLVFCQNWLTDSIQFVPGDFRSSESPQTLPALFIGPFQHVERFRNLKFAVIRITDIQSTVPISPEGTAAIHLAFQYRLMNN